MNIHKIKYFKGEFFKVLETTEKSQVGVMTIEPGADSGPEEIHKGDQIIYVMEGIADIEVGNEKAKLLSGEMLIIPALSRHHIYNRSNIQLLFITIYAPPEY